MLRLKLAAALAALIAFCPAALAGTEISVKRKDKAFAISAALKTVPAGEKLRYEVRWFGIPVGFGEIGVESKTLSDGSAGYLISASAGDNDFLRKFYPLRDDLTSEMPFSADRSLVYTKKLEEGKYRADERIVFDEAAKLARYESLTNGSKKEFSIDGPIHDVLTAFYWFRRQDARAGDTLKTVVFSDEKTYDFSLKILRTERLEIRNVGSFEVFVAEPIAKFKGALVDRGRAWIWFTADGRRIPLKIKIDTKWGPVLGVLEKRPE